MKKYGLHILILVMLIGFFVPVFQADAQTSGICIVGDDNVVSAIDQRDCEVNQSGVWRAGASAVTCTGEGIGKIICQINNILRSVVPVVVALGLVYFVWGVVMYVIADGEEAKKKGKNHMIYGIIGLAVIVGIWGLVNIVVATFGLGSVSAPTIKTVGGGSSCTVINTTSKFQDVINYFTCILNNSIIPLIFALALVIFVWGVVQYVINSGEEAKKEKGRQFMIWGIIGLAVMVSVWGLVNILGNTFGVKTNVLPQVTPPTN